MGNRAVLTFSTGRAAPCVYLHWNGGRDSVEGFLSAARYLGLRHKGDDPAATMDALAEMIARHFFGYDVGMTVYRLRYDEADTDNGDNGTYLLNADMRIAGRRFFEGAEDTNADKTRVIFEHIVERAPIFNN